jgi:hypothetical protein
MKILGVLITLALMQMSCLADGFYFCFKPACTKTYLKFDEKQFKSHLVKKHKCKAITSKQLSMPSGEIFTIDGYANHYWTGENSFFEYANNDKEMHSIIDAQTVGSKSELCKKVYHIIYSKGDMPPGVRWCDCGECLLTNPDAGKRFRDVGFKVYTSGTENNQENLHIFAEWGGMNHFEMIKSSSIPKLAKKAGIKKIIYDTFLDYKSVSGIDNHFEFKL